jgi:hypothetical protein
MVTRDWRKPAALLSSLVRNGKSRLSHATRDDNLVAKLRIDGIGAPWYLTEEFVAALIEEDVAGAINADIEGELARLKQRGVQDAPQALEAFITETRGSQYITAQLLSIRAHCDVSMPFADRAALTLASRIPMPLKVHNQINRALLLERWPQSMWYSTAAILSPAGAPLIIQEASRAVRKGGEAVASWLHSATGGRIPVPRLSWVNFEFMRKTDALMALCDRLSDDVWDRRRIRDTVERMRNPSSRMRTHPMFDQLGKMLTVQGWLSSVVRAV